MYEIAEYSTDRSGLAMMETTAAAAHRGAQPPSRRNRLMTVVACTGALLLSATAWATPPAQPRPTPAPQAPAAAAPAGPSAPTAPAGTGQMFGNWRMICETGAQNKQTCLAAQSITETLSRNIVFVWLLQYDMAGKLHGVFRTVPGVYVNRGLQLQAAASGPPVQVPYELCSGSQCQATFEINADLTRTLTAAKEVSVSMLLTTGQTVSVKIQMDGFAGAILALSKVK